MKISTKGRYALRLMLDLAQYSMEQEYVSIKKWHSDLKGCGR